MLKVSVSPSFPVSSAYAKRFPNDLTHEVAKTVRICHRPAIVKPKRLFINVAEQVKWLNRNVGAIDAALEERDVAVQVIFQMVHDAVG